VRLVTVCFCIQMGRGSKVWIDTCSGNWLLGTPCKLPASNFPPKIRKNFSFVAWHLGPGRTGEHPQPTELVLTDDPNKAELGTILNESNRGETNPPWKWWLLGKNWLTGLFPE
jgi:hypothetical protein